MTSGLEREWDYSGRMEKEGKSKKTDEASKNGKTGKVKDTKR